MFLFQSVIHGSYPLPSKQENSVLSKEEHYCLTFHHLIDAYSLYLLFTGLFPDLVFAQTREWSCGSWCVLTVQRRSLMESSYSILNTTWLPEWSLIYSPFSYSPCPILLPPRGGLQQIIQLWLYHNINTGIDAPLLFSDMSLCAVQCIEMRGWWGLRHWLTRKE